MQVCITFCILSLGLPWIFSIKVPCPFREQNVDPLKLGHQAVNTIENWNNPREKFTFLSFALKRERLWRRGHKSSYLAVSGMKAIQVSLFCEAPHTVGSLPSRSQSLRWRLHLITSLVFHNLTNKYWGTHHKYSHWEGNSKRLNTKAKGIDSFLKDVRPGKAVKSIFSDNIISRCSAPTAGLWNLNLSLTWWNGWWIHVFSTECFHE